MITDGSEIEPLTAQEEAEQEAEWEELRRLQDECLEDHDAIGEDGCLSCGYGAP